VSPDPLYVAARGVLLDALQALAPHGAAVIVAGAQAVYLRTGSTDLGIAPFTTDGDLALDPVLLGDEPALEEAMTGAGFRLREPGPEPGIWIADVTVDGRTVPIPVDLIVPERVAGPGGRRGARLRGHDKRAARRILGLEAVLVDHSTERIAALDPDDPREFDAEVAGVAALFVAKLHKIHDRVAQPRAGRVHDKDAADVYRLMQTSSPAAVAAQLHRLREHPVAGPPTQAALGYLATLFGRSNGAGISMAVDALRLAVSEDEIRAVCVAFVERLGVAQRGG